MFCSKTCQKLPKSSLINMPEIKSNLYHLVKKQLIEVSPIKALSMYTQFRFKGLYVLDLIPLILKACALIRFTQFGRSLHCESVKRGVDSDVVIGTSLLAMYAKCGDLLGSRNVFDNMPARNVVTWNAMIGGYVRNGDMEMASWLFERMVGRNSVTWSEMIDGYARSGELVAARRLFDEVPSESKSVVVWTVMVDGYVRKGEMEAARLLFEVMPERNFYVWSSMVSGYFKIGDVKAGRAMFDRGKVRNLVNWNSLINGCAQNGCCEEALEAFGRMQADGFEPDEVTVAGVLSACAQLGRLDFGEDVHRLICHRRIKLNQFVLNALVDMYAKCGHLINARLIFEDMNYKNSACWNSMISGFAIHGQIGEALELFQKMENSSEKPDEITFLSLLSACAHGGFVEEGLEIFSKMEKYEITANIKHYCCVVDLLGRAGRLKDAYELIKRIPMQTNAAVWGAFLGACRIHSATDLVERMTEEILSLEHIDTDSDHYVLLSNIYAASDNWEKAERMRMAMASKGLQKIPGHSSIVFAKMEQHYTM